MSEIEQSSNQRKQLSRADFLRIAGAAGAGVAAIVVGKNPTPAKAAGKKTSVDTPLISCGQVAPGYLEIQVCAPAGPEATGEPAGFSIQRMTQAALIANGGWYASDDPRLCKASFSGNAFASRYDLTPGGCVTVRMGDLLRDNGASANCTGALACNTTYVFRAFGHANSALNRSDFTADLLCATAPCSNGGPGCTLPVTYWSVAYPASANCPTPPFIDATWPVSALTLGFVSYSLCELVAILKYFVAGNALPGIAHQLIAAKLSIAGGADGSAVAQVISDADAMIGGLVAPPIGAGFIAETPVTTALIIALNDYNNGFIGPGGCCNPFNPLCPGQD